MDPMTQKAIIYGVILIFILLGVYLISRQWNQMSNDTSKSSKSGS